MDKYKFVVFSNALKGVDAEYEDWYVNTHIPEVLNIPGFISGQQHRLCGEVSTGLPSVGGTYMALYEIETDDPQAVMNEISARASSFSMQSPPAIDPASVKTIFVAPIGELRTR